MKSDREVNGMQELLSEHMLKAVGKIISSMYKRQEGNIRLFYLDAISDPTVSDGMLR